jgi:hypothetical protein
LSSWLLKAAVRHASGKKFRLRRRHGPEVWRRMWEQGDVKNWPSEPITGIVDSAGVKLVIDRSEITSSGHLLLDGWALAPETAAIQLEAVRCTIEWQAKFATSRPDVLQALQLSLVGRDAQVGVQILARIADYVPGRSRVALTIRAGAAAPRLIVPVVPEIERSGSMWQSVYDTMRHRGTRDVAYLDTSVRLLTELRKADWHERSAAICRNIDKELPESTSLKVLVLSRLHPNIAYLNLNLLAAARHQPADFLVCSMGQQAIQRANEYRTHFAAIGNHAARFVNAEIGTPSCELIEQFVLSCQRRGSPGLIVYDDVAVASAMASLSQALRQETTYAVAWPRQFPQTGPVKPPFAEPLAANDGPGPYWRSAMAMEQGAIGALLFDPTRISVPPIPPFEGRGYGLEYLFKSALAEASLSGETMIDLLDPAGQREAQGIDMLMLLAS